ncbi:hypothetical protein KDA_42720 [Dictyobacter alpinus]|uniref:ASCH domain-containing protein n=1 Tax=Dictyobacter alpinus TaxID=2014873 RepID=A0A402BBI6_9CHLR|nr:ASCH domain-containing protein [Dictyobacter alpinus]GCE28788.1 hypothetical protein KDA_42720 [Dictyobacter alpinus]
MIISERTAQFGWEDDDGRGMRIIRMIMDGSKTATCSPMFSYTEDELAEIYANKDQIVTVIDKDERPWCNIRMLDVFETPFGDPDPRLVSGEGAGEDAEKFRQDHRLEWKDWFEEQGYALTEQMMLVAEVFELVEVAE